jgi:aldehyde dehydrogenase (NAD+)
VNFIGGKWVDAVGGAAYEKTGPMRPTEVIGEFADSGAEDIAVACDAAKEALGAWAAAPIAGRANYLRIAADIVESRVDRIATDMAIEMGKPIREARGETLRAAQILRFVSGEAYRSTGEHFEQTATGAEVSTRRRPIGVVGLITPWNFPIAIPAWKLAPALVYGNTVVLKLAFEAPRTGLHLVRALADAGLPAGVLNVVTGRGATAGAALVRDPRVRAISFTGSEATGANIRDAAVAGGVRIQLEMGGQNPLVVLADADLQRAVDATYAGAFWSAGQKCTATRRIYVEEPVYDRFRAAFLQRIADGHVGDPLDPETEVGPIVSARQLDDVTAGIARGIADGGAVIAGGARIDTESLLLAPTVFEGLGNASFLSCEEVFGPVASLYPCASFDDALERANSVRFGLAASIFTSSLTAATRFQREAQAGLIHVNSQTAGAEVHVPFGGIKASGFGPHEQGRAAIEFFTETVTTYVDP